MKYKSIRETALSTWLSGTGRQRSDETDDYSSSFECHWQNKFKDTFDDKDPHYSIFCSIGDWNTNITDYLTDLRFDDLNFSNEEDKDILFRQYTKIFLTFSEIMTDFQDILSTFRQGRLLKEQELNDEKKKSRKKLDEKSSEGNTQSFFKFINNICKHKINNIHFCNHHLFINFADSNSPSLSSNTIRINNLNQFIPKNPTETPRKIADTIEIPKLIDIINTILKGYQIVDEEFRSDPAKFQILCCLYEGESVRE